MDLVFFLNLASVLYTCIFMYIVHVHVRCLYNVYLQGLHSIAQPSFVHVSLSISELHEHAYSHCSLLWCEKDIIYQQVIGVLVSYH